MLAALTLLLNRMPNADCRYQIQGRSRSDPSGQSSFPWMEGCGFLTASFFTDSPSDFAGVAATIMIHVGTLGTEQAKQLPSSTRYQRLTKDVQKRSGDIRPVADTRPSLQDTYRDILGEYVIVYLGFSTLCSEAEVLILIQVPRHQNSAT